MCDLKTAFFRFRRWAGKVLRPQTDARTVFRYERSISRECRPRLFPKRKDEKFSPEIYGEGVQKTICFPIHFWTGKKGSIDRRKSPVFVQEIRMPLSRTPPLYSSSFTYSIRSAGWQSKREQITSSVPHDGICPLLIFWSIASPIIFSLRMRVVL